MRFLHSFMQNFEHFLVLHVIYNIFTQLHVEFWKSSGASRHLILIGIGIGIGIFSGGGRIRTLGRNSYPWLYRVK